MPSLELPPRFEEVVNLTSYPIHHRDTSPYQACLQVVRQQLNSQGFCTLEKFITSEALDLAQAECQSLAELAQPTVRFTNPYKTEDDPFLPSGHPIRYFGLRTNAFVSQDKFGPVSLLRMIYHATAFQQFIADCFHQSRIYEYADPLGALVLNVLPPGGEHPWHFDENDFSITLGIKNSKKGGIFEISPNIRTDREEHFEQVSQVLQGKGGVVRQLDLNPASLVLFRGRFSLHRVTKVLGDSARHTVVFSYTSEQGRVGREANNRRIFS